MYPETLNAMGEGILQAVMIMITTVTLIVGLASVLFLILCFVGSVCACFAETGRAARRQRQSVTKRAEPHEDDLLAALEGLDNGLADSLSSSVVRQESTSIQPT